MARIADGTFRNWNNGETMYEADYEQEREILRTAINDNYDRIILKYDKTEVDALLDAMRGAGWTTQTIKGNYDLIQGILTDHYDSGEVDTLIANLQAQINSNDGDITSLQGRMTTAEGDIVALEGRVTTEESVSADHETRIDSLEADNTANQDNITALDNRVSTAETNISSNDSDIQVLDGRIDAHDLDISALYTENDEQDARIDNILNGATVDSEVIDARLGLDGTVHPVLKDRLDQMEAPLIEQDSQVVSLGHDQNVITTDQSTPADVTIHGRTLVNLLGRDGNCEDTSKFVTYQATIALDSTTKVYGSNGIKITLTGTAGYAELPNVAVDSSKYYLVALDTKNGNATNARIRSIGTSFDKLGSAVVTGFNVSYVKLSPTDLGTDTSIRVQGYVTGSIDQYGFIDGIRLYEIDQATYNLIDVDPEYTGDKLAEKFPYVDSVQHVMNPVVKNAGKNLLPPFTEWDLHANATIVSPYELRLDASAISENSYYDLKAITNQAYKLQVTLSDATNIEPQFREFDKDGNVIRTIATTSITTSSNCDILRVYLVNKATGTFTFTNPQLELGSTATEFEPQNESYLYGVEDSNQNPILLSSNVGGSVRDELYKRDGTWYRLNRFERDVVLDGSLDWSFSADYVGLKRLGFPLPIAPSGVNREDNNFSVKNDGKLLKYNQSSDAINTFAVTLSGDYIIGVSDTDSGWTDAMTPTANMIKAYFNGWQYTGDGTTHSWVSLVDGVTTPATQTETFVADPANMPSGFTPYELTYQLAEPTEEVVLVEGDISLIDGGNQIEVSEGVIVREVTNPVLSGDNYYINYGATVSPFAASWLNYKVKDVVEVYKNGQVDTHNWKFYNGSTDTLNGERMEIPSSKFDTSAQYTVTYTTLDKYNLSANVTDVEVTYQTNLKTVVDELVKDVSDNSTRISINVNILADVLARLEAGGL